MRCIYFLMVHRIWRTVFRSIIVLFLFSYVSDLAYASQVLCDNEIGDEKIILIDPGHGGIDGGASGKSGVLEKDINLIIGKKLKTLLEEKGYKVLISREEDKGLYTDDGTIRKKKIQDLENRLKMKKDTNCDMFISIHLNAFPQTQYYGAQVWYGDNAESKKLAQLLQSSLRENLDINNKRVQKPAGNSYRILRDNGTTAAVIVECGFLSNQEEEQKLRNNEYQEKIAESIVSSIKLYYEANKR
jgi:N-acetylmuramoyl-L-alanine amidase